jgi:hypothetical protein
MLPETCKFEVAELDPIAKLYVIMAFPVTCRLADGVEAPMTKPLDDKLISGLESLLASKFMVPVDEDTADHARDMQNKEQAVKNRGFFIEELGLGGSS